MREYLLPGRDPEPDYERVIETLHLTGEDADHVFDALASQMSREVLELLYEEPLPPADIANELDTSVQNIHYHLRKLKAADLIESVEQAYSSRGVEMDVYAPTSEAIVLLTGRTTRTEQIQTLLTRFLGGLGILTVSSLLVHYLWTVANQPSGGTVPPAQTPTSSAGSEVGSNATNITISPTPTPTPTPTPIGFSETILEVPPSVFVFAGGLLILGVSLLWMYRDMTV